VLLDRRLVESAALLHDLDKLPAVKAELNDEGHAEGSAVWLGSRGYPELAPVVAGHPVTLLADAAWFEKWLAIARPETLIVAYADKRAGQRLESMARRFASWERRYPPEARAGRPRGSWSEKTVAAVWRRSEALELRVCEMADVAPDQVRRLPWTSRAIRAATRSRESRGGRP
jgi:hypothetical protein